MIVSNPSPDMPNPRVSLVLDVQSIDEVLDPGLSPFVGPQLHPDVMSYLTQETNAHPKADQFEVVFRFASGKGGREEELRKAVHRFAIDASLQATRQIKQIKLNRKAAYKSCPVG